LRKNESVQDQVHIEDPQRRRLPLSSQLDKRLLHDILGRGAPLPRVQNQRRPLHVHQTRELMPAHHFYDDTNAEVFRQKCEGRQNSGTDDGKPTLIKDREKGLIRLMRVLFHGGQGF